MRLALLVFFLSFGVLAAPSGPPDITWPDGSKYWGAKRFNVPHGRGYLTSPDGKVFEGDFVDGRFQGPPKTESPAERGARFLLGHPDGGKVRVGEHRGRHVVVVGRRRRAAEKRPRERHPVGGRDRRQVQPVGHVTHGVDAGSRGAGLLVDQHLPDRPKRHARVLQAQALRVRRAPGREHHAPDLQG